MRILHVVPTYLPATRYGGPIHSVHGLCSALARRGHDVHVFTTNVDGPSVSDVPLCEPVILDGVSITYFPTGLGRRLYRSPAMKEALKRSLAGFDLAHLHSVFLWPTTAAAALSRRFGVPYVISPRGMLVSELIARKSPFVKRAWIALFDRRNVGQAAAVHVTTEMESAEIRRLGLPVRKFAKVPNGVELPPEIDAKFDSLTNSISGPKVLFIGRINWKKGLDRLIPALAHAPGVQLLLVGNDEENYAPELISLSKQSGVADRTHFLGPLHGSAKWQALAAADIFVLPSYSENFGIAALEAMATGVPVIVTREVGLAEDIADADAGLVVEGDPRSIGDAINRLLLDPAMRRRMGEAGRRIAVEQFSWDVIAEEMERTYFEISGTAKGLR